MIHLGEDYAAILADHGDHSPAVRLFGAAVALRDRLAVPQQARYVGGRGTPRARAAEVAEAIADTRETLSPADWDDAFQAGLKATLEDELAAAFRPG